VIAALKSLFNQFTRLGKDKPEPIVALTMYCMFLTYAVSLMVPLLAIIASQARM